MNVFKLNPNKIILAVLICAVVMLSGLSYAWYKLSLVGEEEITLISGSLELSFNDSSSNVIRLDNAEPISDQEGLAMEAYQFSLRNTGAIDSSYTLYLDDSLNSGQTKMSDSYIKYILEKNGDVGEVKYLSSNETITTDEGIITRMIDSGEIAAGEEATYNLKLWIADTADNGVMGTSFKASLRIEATQKVSKFAGVYTYNEDTCVTGDEDTCVITECYKEKTAGSCPAGTIIKYRVSDTEIIPFHVMFDNGDKIVMQSQKEVASTVAWTTNLRAIGPANALTILEEKTAGWSNVNDLSYEAGVTTFYDNPYTNCRYDNNSKMDICDSNSYVLPKRVAKARMITMQEVLALGCGNTRYSCPSWIYRNINGSVWTMNNSEDVTRAVAYGDTLLSVSSTSTNNLHAVVEVSK